MSTFVPIEYLHWITVNLLSSLHCSQRWLDLKQSILATSWKALGRLLLGSVEEDVGWSINYWALPSEDAYVLAEDLLEVVHLILDTEKQSSWPSSARLQSWLNIIHLNPAGSCLWSWMLLFKILALGHECKAKRMLHCPFYCGRIKLGLILPLVMRHLASSLHPVWLLESVLLFVYSCFHIPPHDPHFPHIKFGK